MSESILGISAYYHDSAAAIIRDGEIIAAAQEERFTRIKHDDAFPINAAKYCLKEAGCEANDLKAVVFYDKPWAKFDRILENYFSVAPQGFSSFLMAIPTWLGNKIWTAKNIDRALGYSGELLFCRHHESHAASAFYPSPFEASAVLTLDGVGEWHSTTWGVGQGQRLELQSKIDYPHSIGLLYSAMTYYTGFKVNSGEYKVMGLAPYGEPKYTQTILDNIIDLKKDGSYRLNMEYFDFHRGLKMTSTAFDQLFGGPPRQSESEITQKEMDLARSIQEVVNMVLLKMAAHIRKQTGQRQLCLAGGVALNCVANGELQRKGIFDDIWIQPAAGDAGGALGAALHAWHQIYEKPRPKQAKDRQKGSLLGPAFDKKSIDSQLKAHNTKGTHHREDQIFDEICELLIEEKVIGLFQGRMEFGPRALGGRSIIGDPRSKKMQSIMNLKIKYRESFRPFAPSILLDQVGHYFETKNSSPYMLLVHPVHPERRITMSEEQEQLFGVDKLLLPRSDIPAITHVDYSARIQTVEASQSPYYEKLIKAFFKKTGCPLVVNTSFNVRGEPIVATPLDAYRCFMRTEMDALVIENELFLKEDQPPWKNDDNWREDFKLD
jgi:carbamoyltransferase